VPCGTLFVFCFVLSNERAAGRARKYGDRAQAMLPSGNPDDVAVHSHMLIANAHAAGLTGGPTWRTGSGVVMWAVVTIVNLRKRRGGAAKFNGHRRSSSDRRGIRRFSAENGTDADRSTDCQQLQ
jgi:hypothetical protein